MWTNAAGKSDTSLQFSCYATEPVSNVTVLLCINGGNQWCKLEIPNWGRERISIRAWLLRLKPTIHVASGTHAVTATGFAGGHLSPSTMRSGRWLQLRKLKLPLADLTYSLSIPSSLTWDSRLPLGLSRRAFSTDVSTVRLISTDRGLSWSVVSFHCW
ncbi:hypothetical protein ElyMa_004048300 [Elysia marginata]|uniref:Uncharacterized protein n=1 Tax=Elysia marginata TaxID=1093978 RepID=A0AAV4G4K6_9GAST|nr:hypothetical protein ElyMa_004048300 [Elysia marginata]